MSLFGQNNNQASGGFGASNGFQQQTPGGFGGQQANFGQQPNAGGFGGGAGFNLGGGASQGFGGATSSFNAAPSSFGGAQNSFVGGMNQQPQGQVYAIEPNEVEVPHPFTDSISDMKCKQTGMGQYLMALSSWDGSILIYQIRAQPKDNFVGMGSSTAKGPPPQCSPMGNQVKTQGPILGICWMGEAQPAPAPQQNMIIFIAHSDGTIKRWDPSQPGVDPQTVGQHDGPVKDVYSFCFNGQYFLVSGGFDSFVKFWTINGPQLQQIGQSWLGKPVQIMSGAFPILVTAHSEKIIHMWNLQNIMQQKFDPITFRLSQLKYPTSSICAFADGKGYAVGSIEGRCSIVNVDLNNPDQEDSKDFCFKCHRKEDSTNKDGDVWTVNHISFNRQFNTFATSGSDGTYIIWNKDTKSRYKSSPNAPMPMTVSCFSEDANILAFASGEDWSLGGTAAQMRQNNIKFYVRACEKDDVFKQKK